MSLSQILVVDDNADKRELLKAILEKAGFGVCTSRDGLEALAAVEAHPPDLIITDVNMPEVDGYELVRRLRSNPKTRYIPVMIETAERKGLEDQRLGAKVGALDYFSDFADFEAFLSRVRTLLEFKAYMNNCEKAAFTDELTSLPNRRVFESELEREIARGIRYRHSFCVLLIDIDDFKQINDTSGHGAGDAAIRRFAETLQSAKRESDLVARLGGDEFGVLMPETDVAGGLEASNRLLAEIRRIGMSGSFGLAKFPQDGEQAGDIIAAADAALYIAKRNGKNQVKARTENKVLLEHEA